MAKKRKARNEHGQLELFARYDAPRSSPPLLPCPIRARNSDENRLLAALGAATLPKPPKRIHGFAQAEIRMLMTPLPRITVWDPKPRRRK